MCFVKVGDFPQYNNEDDLLEKILDEKSDFDGFGSFLVSEDNSLDNEKKLTGKDSPLELLSTGKKGRKKPFSINDTKNNIKNKTHGILD